MNGAEFLKENLLKKKIVILVGAGGVGKTTVSAALGVIFAEAGKRVLVLTIDPAKRLADSLGIRHLGNDPQEVYRAEKGTMYALMLDSKRTFDEMIIRVVKDKETRERILNNRYYQYMSTLVTGSHEYMAMEKLYEIEEEGRFDIIVLDTPPSRNAEDFLQAPKSILDVFDSGVLNFFLSSYSRVIRFGLKTFSRGLRGISKFIEGIVGTELLEGIADFLLNFEGLYGGFRERAGKIFKMLQEEGIFLIVTTAEQVRIEETEYFYNKLREYELNVLGVIFNRTLPELGPIEGLNRIIKEIQEGHEVTVNLKGLLGGYKNLLLQERENIFTLKERLKNCVFFRIDQMEEDVHSLDGLRRILTQIRIC